MKPTRFAAAVLTLFALAACGSQENQTAAPPPAAASEAAAPAVQTLTSRDNTVSITVGSRNFTDQSANTQLLPEGIPAENITLLQEADDGTLLYVADWGKAKSPSAQYFSQLKTGLEKIADIDRLQIGAATENRMAYSFQGKTENVLNESCLAVYADRIYSVCAVGTADPAQLSDLLKEVKLTTAP
ncbi:hypothetical protein V6667_02630 [Neisseria leonii]|uniref:Lipoprotein n=1 Tax=Neisseria leonii TaxID=2995413 RepID=A0A9X4E0P9_9NEIS|nr:hypothetical protein [Neisseria sp. 51.81]MDD9327246.1 hypothetical protein [Neisseria sp. 51.81]